MELNVLNEQGQETAKVAASDTVFGREYTMKTEAASTFIYARNKWLIK